MNALDGWTLLDDIISKEDQTLFKIKNNMLHY